MDSVLYLRRKVCILAVSAALLVVLLSPLVVSAQEAVLDNGYFVVSVEVSTGYGGVGTFTVATGANHFNPDQNVLYGGVDRNAWSSYATLILPDYGKIYVQSTGSLTVPAGYQLVSMDSLGPTVVNTSSYVRATWVIPEGLVVVQEIILHGTTSGDSVVEQRVSITNNGTDPITYGLRFMWDLMIDGEDGSVIRMWSPSNPVTGWLYNETDFNDTSGLAFWQTTNDENNPIFYIWGSMSQPSGSTIPDRFVYAGWGKLFDNPWHVAVDPNLVVARDDTAVAYYWINRTLAPGESATYIQYILPVTKQAGPPLVTAVVGGELLPSERSLETAYWAAGILVAGLAIAWAARRR